MAHCAFHGADFSLQNILCELLSMALMAGNPFLTY